MTDMSVPPPGLRDPDPPDGARAGGCWPAPPYPAYALTRLSLPEDCTIEGLNGKTVHGVLVEFDAPRRTARVRVGASRTPLAFDFEQFLQLTLTNPVRAHDAAGDEALALVDAPGDVEYRLTLADGHRREGRTLGHVETDDGLFLFPPLERPGAVRRAFVPRARYRSASFGRPLGEELVAQHKISAEQLEQALAEQQRLRTRRLGEALVSERVVTAEQLLAALEHQNRMPMMRIGEALMGLGLITPLQLDEALEQQKLDRSLPLGELLVRQGLVSRQDLQTALARKMGYPVVDVAGFAAEAEAVRSVPFVVAHRLNALPLLRRTGRLVVAMDDPTARAAIEELEFVAQAKAAPVIAPAADIARALLATYERFGADTRHAPGSALDDGDGDALDASQLVASLEQQTAAERDDEPSIEQSDNSLVRLVNTMIVDAWMQRVSDIHVETQPGREKLRIRFRRDGVLRPYLELPHTYRAALVARIKIMCDLDISERRRPQDGKINFARFSPQHRLELRVATIPTANGLEDVVMRILASTRPLPIGELGLSAPNLERLRRAVHRPYGLVLCVGPTGSGKTTTLHSLLGEINQPDRKIWTAEDPIEITQAGLRQVQVNPKIDWTFAKALRALLRADPDVIMVGEIRDQETAQVAIEASLTGHLVLSTLHTNSAAETVTRLLDMGMDPFNFGDSLLAVLAQRLVRRLCPHCRTTRDATDAEVQDLLQDHLHVFFDDARPDAEAVLADWLARFGRDGRLPWFTAPGCDHCEGTGFDGRIGLHELLTVTRPLRRLVVKRGSVEQLQRQALDDGTRTLRQDGIEKVLAGLTTIGEVRAMSNV